MAPSKIRRALGAVKDKTSIGLAKVSSSTSVSDLDVAIVKATRHEEYPAEERHVREILSLTCYSGAYVSACVNTLSRRLNKTKNWTVALKTLMLIQRLLSEGDPAYEQEIFFSTRRGTRFLNMSDFRDTSQSNSWDYSAFVRTYALYLDERLEYRMQSRRGKRSAFGAEEEDQPEETNNSQAVVVRSTPVREMKTEQIFSRTQHLQQLLERFLACRPTGAAKNNRVVIVALYPIVKESFQIYYDITEIMGILIDRFMELNILDCVKVYEIFCRVGKQFDELDVFHGWCKSIGIARSSEYPEIEKITAKKLEVMDEFIRDKSALAQCQKNKSQKNIKATKEEEEEDVNKIKALPPPEGFSEAPVEVQPETEKPEVYDKEDKAVSHQPDLLDLGDDKVSSEDQTNKLALALFDGGAPSAATGQSVWQAFSDDNTDWETALVQSATHLPNQRTTLAGGFDMLLLDGMYQAASSAPSMAGSISGVGSASSVAVGSSGRPAMLALPSPPALEGNKNSMNIDPFAASMGVAAPSYVQISEMEKKQRLLMEEQMMWQQYARDGMQGQIGMTNIHQHNPYNMGGYTRNY